MTFTIEAGDFVQARKGTSAGVAVVEFTVTAISGGVYEGSPLGSLDTADGWGFELIQKGTPNLPTVLSDLAVWTVQNRTEPTRVVGPVAGVWQTPQGVRVNPGDVLRWETWAE